MSKILVIGARGRAGSAAVAEARDRGHSVVGVARTASAGLVVGDVMDVGRVAELAVGCDAVIAGVYDGGTDPGEFFPRAARALVDGLEKAGVRRLVWVGLASILPTANGRLLMDTDGYPQEYRSFFLAHQAALDVFAESSLDWVSVAPTGDFDHADPSRKGGYHVGPADAQARISYADLAVALVDEIDHPEHHRAAIGVTV
ncbi:NAD(P)-dependent oxidoreductase [Kribbella speibonae]|uniref:NAD-dependent epimerase/dehydratase family protein n=1 Tax=Kribbella speibonae TaxID=1572660 RepID=A0ABY2A0K3_9ACTN|nr:NAD(P)H-binding protein [Kribbella speibonae]TCC19579.1 NAD-dependent epimerase/dehydratase family protein [Kribbella speibonae]